MTVLSRENHPEYFTWRDAKLRDIQDHPEQHRHSFGGLTACCLYGPMNLLCAAAVDAHPALGYNGGQKCDVLRGPCACGAWH